MHSHLFSPGPSVIQQFFCSILMTINLISTDSMEVGDATDGTSDLQFTGCRSNSWLGTTT